MVQKIVVKKLMTDKDISSKEGEYFQENSYKYIIDEDIDVYKENGEILLKLRKKVIPQNICREAVNSFRDASKKRHENRGASAGLLDRGKMANYIGTFVNPGKFRTRFYSDTSGKLSKQATSNLSPSNIAGFYDRPDRNLKGKGAPCRLTAFNRDYPELWKKSLPFLNKCNDMFKELVSDRYHTQLQRARETPEFVIENTCFSTITLNYSWQTALHRDAGDFLKGFGNLIVLEDHENENTFTGCYTGFPQYGIAVNVRQGDFLAMDVHEWHCNTELIPVNETIKGKWNNMEIKNKWYFNRLSVVCYLRDNMIRCKNLDTNKIQLLKNNDIYDIIYKEVSKLDKPKSLNEYTSIVNSLKNELLNFQDSNHLDNFLKKYLSYTCYYIKDYFDNDIVNDLKKNCLYLTNAFESENISINKENIKIILYIKDNY